MNRAEILKNHFKSNRTDTLKKLSDRSGVHWVTISKIQNGKDCLTSTWDRLAKEIDSTHAGTQQASGE